MLYNMKTKYQIRKERVEQQAIRDFCYSTACKIQARDYDIYGMDVMNQPITLPREIAMVLLDKDLPLFFPKDTFVGTVMGRKINLY